MADAKVTALSALAAVTGDDLLYVVDDPGGTPASKKATAAVLRDYTGMVHSTVTGTSGAISAAVNTLYVADMSGWSANRTLTLPATAAVGDRVGMMVTVGDADYEWIVQANTGDTLNGVTAAEWSRLFISGEVIVMRCVEADAAWVVEVDGRIAQLARMSLTSGDIATSSTGWVGIDMDTKEIERGCVVTVAGAAVSTAKWRRASYISITGNWLAKSGGPSVGDNEVLGWGCSYGGVPGVGTIMSTRTSSNPGTTASGCPGSAVSMQSVPAGSLIQISQYAATTANLGCRGLAYSTYLSLVEIL